MKKPAVDYTGFRLRELCSPRFSHLLLLLGWVGYLVLFFLTENLIPAERCTPVHIRLDDWIPFCEWFLIPYVLWYGLIVFSLGWFLLYDLDCFKRLQIYFMITQVCAMAVYILLPNRQDLRPEVLPRDNFLTRGVAFLYRIDTNTGVCPSLHVACSLAMASVWLKRPQTRWYWKLLLGILVVLICMSTMFLKQHSAADFFAALPVCLLGELLIYGKDYWLPRWKKSPTN